MVKLQNNPLWVPLNVVYTDYENMAVVHSCVSFLWGLYSLNYEWVLARKPLTPDGDSAEYDKVTAKAKSILESNLINFKFEDHMRPTHQGDDCSY